MAEKSFEEMNQIEKFKHNAEYNLKVHHEALLKMESDSTPFVVVLTIRAEIEKLEKWIAELQGELDAGKTEL